jgi:ABC-2 type transport system permease protein
MTTTAQQADTTQAGAVRPAAALGGGAASIIADVPEPHPTLVKTFAAMMAREGRVLRRNMIGTFMRSVMQPLLFVFVFTYVLPKIGSGAVFSGGARATGTTFATVLLPGLMASMLFTQGIMAVTFPLVMEFSWQRTIEDRALAPVPIRVLAIQKITAGAVQAVLGGLIVIPIVLLVHAAGQSPHVSVTDWPLLVVIMILGSLLTSALGLLLGTLMDPRKMQMLFAAILLPATMLGCVYYPWSAMHNIRWLQILVLINPMVYLSEGLRAVLTPQTGHLALWAIMLVLVGGTALLGYFGIKTFTNRVLN